MLIRGQDTRDDYDRYCSHYTFDEIGRREKRPRKETLYREMRIVQVAEQIMAASVNPLSSSRAVTRDDAFANGWRTVRTRRERRNLTRVCRTRATTMDALFAARRLQIAKVDPARNRDGESPRITSNSHSRVILDLA